MCVVVFKVNANGSEAAASQAAVPAAEPEAPAVAEPEAPAVDEPEAPAGAESEARAGAESEDPAAAADNSPEVVILEEYTRPQLSSRRSECSRIIGRYAPPIMINPACQCVL